MENTETLNFRGLNEILCESRDICMDHEHLSCYFLINDQSSEAQLDFQLGNSPALPASLLPNPRFPLPALFRSLYQLMSCVHRLAGTQSPLGSQRGFSKH